MAPRKLSIWDYIVLIVLAAAALFVFGCIGWVAGTVIGLTCFGTTLDAPAPPGVGMAPNLGPLVEASAQLIAALILGTLSGLALGGVLVGLLCRYVLAPLFAQWPFTGTDDL
jgi:hypothetical protein